MHQQNNWHNLKFWIPKVSRPPVQLLHIELQTWFFLSAVSNCVCNLEIWVSLSDTSLWSCCTWSHRAPDLLTESLRLDFSSSISYNQNTAQQHRNSTNTAYHILGNILIKHSLLFWEWSKEAQFTVMPVPGRKMLKSKCTHGK